MGEQMEERRVGAVSVRWQPPGLAATPDGAETHLEVRHADYPDGFAGRLPGLDFERGTTQPQVVAR